jgi:hypothetical protein
MEGQGVVNVKIWLEDQPVLATSMLPVDRVLGTIKKTKRKTTYAGVKSNILLINISVNLHFVPWNGITQVLHTFLINNIWLAAFRPT